MTNSLKDIKRPPPDETRVGDCCKMVFSGKRQRECLLLVELLLTLNQTAAFLNEVVKCYQCDSISYLQPLSSCDHEATCQVSQICHVSLYLNDSGQANHRSGCSDMQACTHNSDPGILIGKREVEVCRSCCLGNKCNDYPCVGHSSEICTSWGLWTSCDVTCGGGRQTRTKQCLQKEDKNETRECNKQNCPEPCVDTLPECTSEISLCQSALFMKYCAKSCGLCRIDGHWSDWTPWSGCSATCGDSAHQIRLRWCNNPAPKNNGTDCFGSFNDTQKCGHPCPVNGHWSGWSAWANCNATCGGGMTSRVRACSPPAPNAGGTTCQPINGDTETTACATNECPIDGHWSPWSPWTHCNVTCGSGLTSRFRSCSNPVPKHGGKPCLPATGFRESHSCATNKCPVDGHWAEWSPWHPCNVTCGGGVAFRSRTCSSPLPEHGGHGCPNPSSFIEMRLCNMSPCTMYTDQTIMPTIPANTYSTRGMSITSFTDRSASTKSASTQVCADSGDPHCNEHLYTQFACAHPELAGQCAKTCGLCH